VLGEISIRTASTWRVTSTRHTFCRFALPSSKLVPPRSFPLIRSLGEISTKGCVEAPLSYCGGTLTIVLRQPDPSWYDRKNFLYELGLDGVFLTNYTRIRAFKGAVMAELLVLNQASEPVPKERLPMPVQVAAGLEKISLAMKSRTWRREGQAGSAATAGADPPSWQDRP
jgi:hypothetical protein